MIPSGERKLETRDVLIMRERSDILDRVRLSFTTLRSYIRSCHDAERLSARLRRDAGLDDLEIERKLLIKAPLIR